MPDLQAFAPIYLLAITHAAALAAFWWLPWLIWPAFCFALAFAQGRLMQTLRAVPPGTPEAARNNAALHRWLLAAYCLPVGLLLSSWPAAVLARVLVFDPALNWGAGRGLFEVGATAWTDRMLRRLAPANPARLRFGLWLACLAAALVAGYLLRP